MSTQTLLCNQDKYMFLILRKQAVFKMSNIDGIAKNIDIVYLLKINKTVYNQSLQKYFYDIYGPGQACFQCWKLNFRYIAKAERWVSYLS